MIRKPEFRRRVLCVAIAAAFGFASETTSANPVGPQVVNGKVSIQNQGPKLNVTNTPGAIINWQGFSISKGETTNFQQQSSSSAVLNRVTGQDPSQILGTLSSNGKVLLVNPNGMVFGQGSVINTQGFVGSTLNISDEDFKAGKLRFANGGAAGNIKAEGSIAGNNGDVYLIAPKVETGREALIVSEGGNVVLAAGEKVEIAGRNLNDIKFEIKGRDNQAVNLGTLKGGAVGVFAGTLTHSGVIQARTLANEGGRIVLRAQGDITLSAGSQTIADGNSQGGSISIKSDMGNITAETTALVSARATAIANPGQAAPMGGDIAFAASAGIVAIERNAQVTASGGKGGSINVSSYKFIQDGLLEANGSQTNGGSVTLAIDNRIQQTASAVVSATGVTQGGSIDLAVSADTDGSGYLFTSGTIDASASTGVGGKVTLSGRELTFASAWVEASGDAGGGSILAGGGKGGKDQNVPNSQSVIANAAANFRANARRDGDGGTTVLWSDGTTRVAGNLEARGGELGGNGGFIEVSGKEGTQFTGMANAGTTFGKPGTFLLDPKFILIQAALVIPGVSVELLDPNPGSNNAFGTNVQVLSNGNILIRNSNDDFAGSNSGAVYLYDGTSGALLSNLRGSAAGDQVGSGGLVTATGGSFSGSGAFYINSPNWSGNAGALTFGNAVAGVSGVVNGTNSLIGANPNDQVASGTIQSLGGGRTAILIPSWNNNMGAITWGSSTAGVTGVVGAGNSLVGSTAGTTSTGDRVGNNSLGFVGATWFAMSSQWSNSKGAITFVDTSSALPVGAITSSNSLVGATAGDQIGSSGIGTLTSGKIMIRSPNWNGNMGAITWGSSTAGVTGVVGAGNSLVGSTAGTTSTGDRVGNSGTQYFSGITTYAFINSQWTSNTGAVTFIDTSSTLPVGAITSSNSLVGAAVSDQIGSFGIATLTNGKIAIYSPSWNGNMGAITWGSSTAGVTGVVGASNSLVGSTGGDRVGNSNLQYLSGSTYASINSQWTSNTGAVTFIDTSSTLPMGAITSSNSLVGATTGDQIGSFGIDTLTNGKIAIYSPSWNGNRGAITWGSSTAGVTGVVGAGNSLVGSTAGTTSTGDRVGSNGLQYLNGSTYASINSQWTNSTGAVTFVDTSSTLPVGAITSGNSLVGATTGDQIGSFGIDTLGNGKIAIYSPSWNGNMGAITWGSSTAGVTGVVGAGNSLVGSTAGTTSTGDRVGSNSLQYLNGSTYASINSQWTSSHGAVTFVDTSSTLPVGAITSGNSLIGAAAGDQIGSFGIDTLGNGKIAIYSPSWNGNMGAITWGSDTTGVTGVVGAGNSLVGSTAGTTSTGDRVGNGSLQYLNGSTYYASNAQWSGNIGAVTFVDTSSTLPVGAITSSNSLVGSTAGTTSTGDRVGSFGIVTLGNGKIAIYSPNWNGNMGAITWGSDTTGATGVVGAGNSLVGSTAGNTSTGDRVGNGSLQYLNGSTYYSSNSQWSGNTGAVTFVDTSSTLPVGAITSSNSLVGSTGGTTSTGDRIGSFGIGTLGNGKIAIFSPNWNGNRGAITWGSDTTGVTGVVGAPNSLVGSTAGTTSTGDRVGGNNSLQFLSGTTWYARTSQWTGSTGAITFVDTSSTLPVGLITSSNSLVGATAGDGIGSGNSGFIQSLSNGKFAILSPGWGGNMGAITWVGGTGMTGVVGAGNSLVGSTAGTTSTGDRVGNSSLQFLSGATWYERNLQWNANRGAVTWIDTNAPATGAVSATNSLVGSTGGTASTGDRVGSGGVFVPSSFFNGGYYVLSPQFAGLAGAVTIGTASAPFSGVVSGANSLVGQAAGDGYGTSVSQLFTGAPGRLLVKASSADSGGLTNNGRVHIYAGGAGGSSGPAGPLGSQLFSDNSSASVTITPAQIAAITNTGTAVVLQANNDIFLDFGSDIVTMPVSGRGGSLRLQAGRSVSLNSNIVTGDGNLRIDANDPLALPSYRDPGAASITMANGTAINAGTGNVEMYLHSGNGQQGGIGLRSISANKLFVQNDTGGIAVGASNASAASDILVANSIDLIAATTISVLGGHGRAHALVSGNGQITIDPPQLIMKTGDGPDAYARIVNPSRAFPIILHVSSCVDCVFVSPYEITGLGQDLSLGNYATSTVLSLNPYLLDGIPINKKSKGSLEVEGDDTCK